MLAGSDNFVKPDRMVLRFLETALSRRVMPQEAAELLRSVAQALSADFPSVTPRLLDHEVWKYQRSTATA